MDRKLGISHEILISIENVQEDRVLIRAVQMVQNAISNDAGMFASNCIKWPDVAKKVPQRTGKQCRERYINHLASTVVATEWTPVEDAIVCSRYRQVGTRWTFISKFLPGRSDNNVKNRFHFLRRQLEKQAALMMLEAAESAVIVHASIKNQIRRASEAATKPHDELASMIADLTMHTLGTGQRVLSPNEMSPIFFGPFEVPRPTESVSCKRCDLFVPSRQTGLKICSKTGWCINCSQTMVYLSDDLLRLEHNLRRDTDSTETTSRDETLSIGNEKKLLVDQEVGQHRTKDKVGCAPSCFDGDNDGVTL